jgi:hypothetical protein
MKKSDKVKVVVILKRVLKDLRKAKRTYKDRPLLERFYGLCGLLGIPSVNLSVYDYTLFHTLLEKTSKNQEIFFDHENNKCRLKSQFLWKFGVYAPRERWLKEQIKKLS